MPTEPRCNVCKVPATTVAVAELTAKGIPLRQVAARLKIPWSSLQRHAVHAGLGAKKPGRPRARGEAGRTVLTGRSKDGRCRACGQLTDASDEKLLEPRSILRRIEANLSRAERVGDVGEQTGDLRLVLSSCDRCHRLLETLAKATGLIGSDVTVNIKNAETLTLKRAFEIVVNAIDGERRQKEFLRIFQAFYAGAEYALPVTIDASEIESQSALNAAP